MRNQQHYGYPPANDYSPLRENYLLKVDDIQGAKPRIGHSTKFTQHYENRLLNNNPVFEHNRQVQERLYASGNYHQSGPNPFTTAKKHYNVHHESEIARSGVMMRNEGAPQNLNTVEFPRNLTTEDIPGASPGTLQSKTVKNHELAQKLRGKSVGSGQIPNTRDALDHFQRQQHEMNQEAYRYVNNDHRAAQPITPAPRNANNQHFGQYHHMSEQQQQPRSSTQNQFYDSPPPQQHPRHSTQEQFYAAPPPQYQQDYRGGYEQSTPLEEKKTKHVVFKEEPRQERDEPSYYREQPNQYREQQPSQYKEQFSPYGEPAYPYRDQPNASYQQQDYLDTYNSQDTGYNLTNQTVQDYQMPPGSGHGHSTKRDQLDQLNQEIIAQQQALERKARETMRGRGFNIITNGASNANPNGPINRKFGSSIKAMVKNTEGARGYDFGATRGWAPAGDYGQHAQNNQEYRNNEVAGGLNDYNETNYRYANKPGQMEPLPQEQFYGSKALKNLSGVKLY